MSDLFLADPEQRQTSRRALRQQPAHARSRAHRRRRGGVVLALVFALLAGTCFVLWSVFGGLFDPAEPTADVIVDYPGPGSGQVQVTVAAGDTGDAIGATLTEAGVVATAQAFSDAYTANPQATAIQPGTYALHQRMRAADAVNALLDQGNRVSSRVTIPEGYTVEQVYQRLYEVTTIPVEDYRAAAADPAALGVPVPVASVEGWLSPATYDVEPGADAVQVLSQMVARTVWELNTRGVPADQMQDVLTKASIVEREARRDEDRPKTARVIENRLREGMMLQVDATTLYGLGVTRRGPTRAELDDASNPYNTHEHLGLPPTPIAAPGAASLDAVLSPTPGNWRYWVTVNFDTGETLFAETYPEQLENEALMDEWLAANGY